jgi:hypothetical protein
MVLIVSFLVFILSFLAAAILSQRFMYLLQSECPEIWRRLGAPEFLSQNRLATCWLLLKFLFMNEYREHGDGQLLRAGGAYKWGIIAYAGSFGLFLMLLVLQNVREWLSRG